MQTFTDLYKYRFVLTNLVSKNLKVMYRRMSLGLFWTLLNPLVMIVTLSVVWRFLAPSQTTFAAMVIVVMIPYNFFVYCLTGCVSSIPGNASLVKKISFPRQILPISIIATHLIHFAIQSVLIVCALGILPHPGATLGFQLIWLVPIFIVQLGLCIGSGLLVAGLSALYRDVHYIIESLLTVLFWLSPIIYEPKVMFLYKAPPDLVSLPLVVSVNPGHPLLYALYHLNPLAGILSAYRSVLYYGRAPDWDTFSMAILLTLLVGFFGVRTFWKHEREFADLI